MKTLGLRIFLDSVEVQLVYSTIKYVISKEIPRPITDRGWVCLFEAHHKVGITTVSVATIEGSFKGGLFIIGHPLYDLEVIKAQN